MLTMLRWLRDYLGDLTMAVAALVERLERKRRDQ